MNCANRSIVFGIIATTVITGFANAQDLSVTRGGDAPYVRLRFLPPTLNPAPIKSEFAANLNCISWQKSNEFTDFAVVPIAYTAATRSDTIATAPVAASCGTPGSVCYDDCCADCCAPCPTLCPCAYGYVEGLIFWRDNRSGNQPLVLDQNTGDSLLSTGDLAFDATGGVRAVVGKQLPGGTTLEVAYFGLFDSTASERVTGTNDLQLPGDLGLVVNNFFGADVVDVSYRSSVHSVEANFLCCNDCCGPHYRVWHRREWAPFIGFRYLNLNEDFDITSTDFQEGTTDYEVSTRNNLFGAQLGGRYRVWRGSWSWEAVGKAGIFGNAAEQSAPAIVDFLDVVRRPAQSETGGSVAFVGELNFTGIYHFDDTWGLRAGYNLLWIDGVALAPDQLDFTNDPDSGTGLDTSGSVLLHGVSVGLEARW